jgi:hypothetical protein
MATEAAGAEQLLARLLAALRREQQPGGDADDRAEQESSAPLLAGRLLHGLLCPLLGSAHRGTSARSRCL